MTIREEYKKLQEIDRDFYSRFEKLRGKNGEDRYSDVLPYAWSAVKLKKSDFTESGYINANYIRIDDEECIATQGPLSNTSKCFWQMVWEELCKVDNVNIIMVTELSEGGREKCFDYISIMREEVSEVFGKLGGVNVQFKEMFTICEGKVEIREILVEGGKIVRHVWIRGWPDFGVPINDDCNVNVIRWLEGKKVGKVFNIVHCSAGVGRSGTFIGLDYILRKGGSIFEIVLKMRKCRVMMVQRINQYEYLYKNIKSDCDFSPLKN